MSMRCIPSDCGTLCVATACRRMLSMIVAMATTTPTTTTALDMQLYGICVHVLYIMLVVEQTGMQEWRTGEWHHYDRNAFVL